MAAASNWHMLPADLLEMQIGQIDLLLAMFPEDILVPENSRELMDKLRDGGATSNLGSQRPQAVIELCLNISDSETSATRKLHLDLAVPFTYDGEAAPEEAPVIRVRIQQPEWLNRAATAQLIKDVVHSDNVLETIENIQEAAQQRLAQCTVQASEGSTVSSILTGPLVRVWFYFPSISTRSKRDDFILQAPHYALTGFLYAGKPGLLCVEGTSKNIDDYMKWIKTESWGDIPAHHKKVSERYREDLSAGKKERAFADMQEITDLVGERRGTRANRGDMKAVEEWLTERGVGEAFARVLM